MTCGIYVITHRASGRIYVGQSINIENRWRHHRWLLGAAAWQRHHKGAVDAMWLDCHGSVDDHFLFEVIEKVDPARGADYLNELERWWERGFREAGLELYNAKECGGACGKTSAVTRAKISAAQVGKVIHPAIRARMSSAQSVGPILNVSTGSEYYSLQHAADSLGICKKRINKALRTGHKCAGYYWRRVLLPKQIVVDSTANT